MVNHLNQNQQVDDDDWDEEGGEMSSSSGGFWLPCQKSKPLQKNWRLFLNATVAW